MNAIMNLFVKIGNKLEKLNRTDRLTVFGTLKEWFGVFIKNIRYILAPVILVTIAYYLGLTKIPAITKTYGPEAIKAYANIGFYLNSFLAVYAQVVIINVVSSVYKNEKKGFAEYFKLPVKRFIFILILSAIIYIGITVGTLLLVVPGILLSLGWTVAMAACYNEEDEGPTTALGRSWELTAGSKGQIFLMLLLLGIIYIVYFLVFYYVNQGGMITFSSITDGTYGKFASSNLYLMVNSIITIPVMTSLSTVIYFKLKGIKESSNVIETEVTE